MNRYLLALLLVSIPMCHAMDSGDDGDYVPSGGKGKRERVSGSAEQSSSLSDEDGPKHTRVSGQLSVQKGKLFAVNLSDPTKVNSFADRGALTKTCMRKLIKRNGITCALVSNQIQALWQAQDTDALRADYEELKQYCMKCPSCDAVLETDSDKKTLFTQVFKHWFFTQQHQPLLFAHIHKLVAISEADARTNFRTHGLPKVAVVPLPQLAHQEEEPMDEGEDGAAYQEDEEDGQEQQDNGVEPALEEEHAHAKWYIVVTDPAQKHKLTVFEESTREQVVALYLASKIPHLSHDCTEVQAQGKQLELNEELVKQLMVQDKKAPKKLVCPDEACEVMFTQEGAASPKSLSDLFEKMALHHMKTHPIESDNVLAQKATHLAASSFEQAYANVQDN